MVLLCIADIHGSRQKASGLDRVLAACPEAQIIVVGGDITHLGGAEEAEKVLAPFLASGKRVLAVAGNMDREGVGSFLRERGLDLHGHGVTVEGIGFHGLGGSNPTPFGTPFEVPPVEAKRLLEAGHAEIRAARFRVLISHAPPKGTRLDRSFSGMHVGSEEVRAFIEASQPDLCLSGHIHESQGQDMLGKTLCVNTGAFKDGRYALVSIQDGDITLTWRNT